jgi:hypothetical protein
MRIAAALVACLCLALLSGPALAGDEDVGVDNPPVVTDDIADRIDVIVHRDGIIVVAGESGRANCTYRKVRSGDLLPAGVGVDIGIGVGGEFVMELRDDGITAHLYEQICRLGAQVQLDYFFIEERTPQDNVFAVREELSKLVPPPAPSFSPGVDVNHLVGLATWVWVSEPEMAPVTAEVTIPGLTTTAIGRPTGLYLDPGDGSTPLECSLLTIQYSADINPTDEHCTHTYRRISAHSPTGRWDFNASVIWEVTWSDTDGNNGVADPIETEATFPLEVIELQARTTNG